MQNSAALAYQQVGKQTVAPRVLEANLLSKSAAQLQRIRDDWDAALATAVPWTAPSPPAADSLIYTSGTSGNPKGVKRRPPAPEQAAASEAMRARLYGIGAGARVLVPAPLYHTAPNLFAHRAVALADLLLAPVVDRRDVGMRQRRNRVRFAFEPRQRFRTGCDRRRNDLDRDVTVQTRIACALDLPHATRSKRGADVIRADAIAGRKRHCAFRA